MQFTSFFIYFWLTEHIDTSEWQTADKNALWCNYNIHQQGLTGPFKLAN